MAETGSALFKLERQRRILQALHDEGKVLAHELCQRLGVSEDTIRRDLRDLAAQNKLQRVHGGALPRSPATGSVGEREAQAPGAKAALAEAAAQYIQDGQVVLLDGGTTNLQVARALPPTLRATVATPSPAIALALLALPQVEVLLLGGRVARRGEMAVGIATAEAVRGLRADVCLLGVCSLHPELGITVEDAEEAQLKRTLVAQSADVIAVAVAAKLGTALPFVVGPLSVLTHLVTERAVPSAALEPYRAVGLTLVLR
jgi:DeoR/GlpR family transcriptional regulator of sugar metabolism